MGCCISSAEAPPGYLVGTYHSDGGRHLQIDGGGKVVYKKPGMEINGMGMNGWESEDGAKGNICCISFRLKITGVVGQERGRATEFDADGDHFRRGTGPSHGAGVDVDKLFRS
jgi:hypothetical protein